MCGVLLTRPPSKVEIINDLDGNIANWWRVLRDQPQALERLIKATEHGREVFDEAKAYLSEQGKEPIKWAWATHVVLRFSVQHSLGKSHLVFNYKPTGGLSGRRDFYRMIEPIHRRLKDVQIENRCALHLLDRMKSIEDSVIYCDPPYQGTDNNAYLHREINREALSNLLLAQAGRVAISGFNDDWDHLDWKRHSRERKSYVFQGFQSDTKRVEVLWTNY